MPDDVAKAGDIIPLEKLNGRIIAILGSDIPALCFDCPKCSNRHWQSIPFWREDPKEVKGVGKVWRRIDDGPDEDVDTITLAPSYNTRCLHCYVRAGCVQIL